VPLQPPPLARGASPAFEIVSPSRDDAPSAAVADDLLPQRLRRIDPRAVHHAAAGARIPLEPAAMTQADLDEEHALTLRLSRQTLPKDPRAAPADANVSTDHMRRGCVSCANYRALRALLNGSGEPVHIGTEAQLFLDDFILASWTNAMRFLAPPAATREVLREPRSAALERTEARRRAAPAWASDGGPDYDTPAARFGCPCSAIALPGGRGVRLVHAAGSFVSNASWAEAGGRDPHLLQSKAGQTNTNTIWPTA
jgi:hypothetical protein